MQIIDLTEEHQNLYFLCLEDWSDEIREAGDHKENWYDKMKDKGFGVKLAIDKDGKVFDANFALKRDGFGWIFAKSRRFEDPCSPSPIRRDLHFGKLHSAWLMAYGSSGR